MPIIVVAHDIHWASQAEVEAQTISQSLGEIVRAIHHIGSTAIPGIVAKPILDFLLEVSTIDELELRSGVMLALGYESKGEYGIPGRRYYRKTSAQGIRTHQVHAFQEGSREVERHLAFRDYLIAHTGIAQSYSALKQELANKHPDDIAAYMDGKDPFITEHEARALEWRSRQSAF